ncbi:hypothetical protein PR202_gb19075 [Eleusine coracana subsp. coracana]|uniref:F-box domain-containing protein n=1 Tax=Eleusine coracana subsp. coracana TaxID=191504 RepID=A0AAV5F709_ELECO|nr:hypothetical protein PR202_gb19075 [Eleusine coracana subsp. coracana]
MEAAGDLDRISALPDDLLYIILDYLPDVTVAARTAVLSRRWRRICINARCLALSETTEMTCATAPCRFAEFVDWVLAQRGDDDVESLHISMRRPKCASVERVNEWIRYAMQHVVESSKLYMPPYCSVNDYEQQQEAVVLPSHGAATSIWMDLRRYRLQLPAISGAVVRYEKLTTLSLSVSSFVEVGGFTLGDFVSTSCPRLRKLKIEC